MKITYPLAAQKDYTELLYSLRSVEKHITPPYEIILIGSVLPDWITKVTWIQLGDIPGKKQLSIRRKILAALEYADEILFMNDDVYLTKPYKYEYYYFNTLKSYSESGSKTLMKQLQDMGKPIKHFDIHYPVVYNKHFKEASELFSEDVILISMYCNYFEIEGLPLPDNKLIKKMDINEITSFIESRSCFSTGTYSLKSALPLLGKLFPNKSKFEL